MSTAADSSALVTTSRSSDREATSSIHLQRSRGDCKDCPTVSRGPGTPCSELPNRLCSATTPAQTAMRLRNITHCITAQCDFTASPNTRLVSIVIKPFFQELQLQGQTRRVASTQPRGPENLDTAQVGGTRKLKLRRQTCSPCDTLIAR